MLAIIETERILAGVDEVGRGAVAGPVVAGACVLTAPLFRRRHSFPRWSPFKKSLVTLAAPHRATRDDIVIADSKLLTPEERERAYVWITAHCFFGIGIVSESVIDERGILFATNAAMLLAIEDLRAKTEIHELLVDGRDTFRFPLPHRSIIRGDQTEPAIAAGSIVAKVTRDRMMRDCDKKFPLYGFAQHKGYGTLEHLSLITQHGTCLLHRKSFLRAHLENQCLPLTVE